MFNKLRSKMVEQSCSTKELAQVLGISQSTLSRRFNGKHTFTIIEVGKCKERLALTDTEVSEIFFNVKVS